MLLFLGAGFFIDRVIADATSEPVREARRVPTTQTGAVAEATTSTLAAAVVTTTSTTPPTTQTTTVSKGVYDRVVDVMVSTLSQYDARIPHIGDVIDQSAPEVPQEVFDELNMMVAELRSQRGDLSRASAHAPAGKEVPNQWLDVAASYMMYQAEYALAGAEAMGDARHRSSAQASFSKAKQAREGFLSAFATYQEITAGRDPAESIVSG